MLDDKPMEFGGAFWVGIIAIIVCVPVGNLTIMYFQNQSKCPKCGKVFCIDYLDTKTITESTISKIANNKKEHYRVGVKRITWKCKSCGYESEGDVKYKEKV
ncbi:hypothetical protein [Helicobacter fennelliae]|uniref:Uncharacterized protein n=1 Tax=Helicobacter fennelliae TaxID=215 RepID=A0A2X3B9A0_9HELI|nr:hypothetical protein [Helicobacter fennelliae]SQB97481.1 Uncharacterised protein [Helicobacter fennelliae]STQ83438.1 Uncharacterised protein [Helicobacter fennelliae]